MKPEIIKTIPEMQIIRRELTGSIGFVPTMGFLHEGHLSLIREAKAQCDNIIVSIYVNPSQFAPNEDLDAYPKDFERDYQLLSDLEVDYLFFPNNEEMYPHDYNTWIEVGGISNVLCGNSRPTHFRGVSTIVAKLVNIVLPDKMFMGEKDFQQIAVLKRMLKDLNFLTKIVPCPIVREPDGLAMSSRNKYLDENQRKSALCLSQATRLVRESHANGNNSLDDLREIAVNHIENVGGIIDYIDFRQSDNLELSKMIDDKTRLFLAVFIGKTRLIDNSLIK